MGKNEKSRWPVMTDIGSGSIQCIPLFPGFKGQDGIWWNLNDAVLPFFFEAELQKLCPFGSKGECFFFLSDGCCGEVGSGIFLRWFRKHSEWKHFKKIAVFLMLHDHPSTLIKHRWISKNRNGFNMGQNLQWFLIIDIVLGSRMTPKSVAKK